ncbi:reverse transcriptase domain-containing protein [Tanacetum coccineum]
MGLRLCKLHAGISRYVKGMSPSKEQSFSRMLKTTLGRHPIVLNMCESNDSARRVRGPQEAVESSLACYNGIHWGSLRCQHTPKKVFESRFYWPTIYRDAYDLVTRCDTCQRQGKISQRDEMPTKFFKFVKSLTMGIDFKGLFRYSEGTSTLCVVRYSIGVTALCFPQRIILAIPVDDLGIGAVCALAVAPVAMRVVGVLYDWVCRICLRILFKSLAPLGKIRINYLDVDTIDFEALRYEHVVFESDFDGMRLHKHVLLDELLLTLWCEAEAFFFKRHFEYLRFEAVESVMVELCVCNIEGFGSWSCGEAGCVDLVIRVMLCVAMFDTVSNRNSILRDDLLMYMRSRRTRCCDAENVGFVREEVGIPWWFPMLDEFRLLREIGGVSFQCRVHSGDEF